VTSGARRAAPWRLGAWLLCGAVFACALVHAASAAAQPPEAPKSLREARFEWDPTHQWLYASFAFRDVVDAAVLRKLRLGLPTSIVLTGLLYAQGVERPLASTVQNCKITWHVWEEMYRIEITRTNQRELQRHWSPTVNGVLRRCAEADRLLVANTEQLPTTLPPLVLSAKILVNPVSPELLAKIERWVTKPANTATASPGSVLFSTFTGLFMSRIGEAERVLEFLTTPALPR
jgi:hypothetical protein